MTDTLISFETAKLAKEKGFYDTSSGYAYFFGKLQRCDGQVYNPKDRCDASTQSLLQKWLRETHDIHVTVFTFYRDGIFIHRVCKVMKHTTIWSMEESSMSFREFHKYEEALEIGLQEALKLIKT
jgi:hypothetical protein